MLALKISKIELRALPFEAGQNVWLRILILGSLEEAVIREKCREPNSYMVEIPATGQCFRRNSNFIKPRQTDKNSVSTDPYRLQDSQRFLKNLQYSNSQVA